jgi:mono/diheme cytochrome c family protein
MGGLRGGTHLSSLLAACLTVASGCQQKMAVQPRYNPLQPSAFFEDGRSARPLVHGTVAQGQLREDAHFFTGVKSGKVATPAKADGALYQLPDYADTFPFPPEEFPRMLRRGQERFNIYCSVCHGRLGDGEGMIVQRGFTRPPNLATDLSRGFKLRGVEVKLRDAPVGYFFEVISNGFGAMPDYSSQVPPADRWAILSYVRALQFSQNVPFNQLNEAERRLLEAGGKN